LSWVPDSLTDPATHSEAAAIFGALLLGVYFTRFFRWVLGMFGLGS
jgi:hypothetical protein